MAQEDGAVMDAGPGSGEDARGSVQKPSGIEPKSGRGAGAGAKQGRVPVRQRARAALARGEGDQAPFRRRALIRVYRLLTRTPDDGSGTVPGTPFTKAGVVELMSRLRERASNQGAPGAKVAASAIGFLAPSDGNEEVVSGVSVAKLQAVARMASRVGARVP